LYANLANTLNRAELRNWIFIDDPRIEIKSHSVVVVVVVVVVLFVVIT